MGAGAGQQTGAGAAQQTSATGTAQWLALALQNKPASEAAGTATAAAHTIASKAKIRFMRCPSESQLQGLVLNCLSTLDTMSIPAEMNLPNRFRQNKRAAPKLPRRVADSGALLPEVNVSNLQHKVNTGRSQPRDLRFS